MLITNAIAVYFMRKNACFSLLQPLQTALHTIDIFEQKVFKTAVLIKKISILLKKVLKIF